MSVDVVWRCWQKQSHNNTSLEFLMKNWLLFLVLGYGSLAGQDLLTLDEAMDLAVTNNLGIQASELAHSAVQMQVYRANAGFGPKVDLNANLNTTINEVKQNFIDGRVVDRFGRSYAPNINVGLRLPIYDGGRMQATLEKLGKLSEVSSLETQIEMQNILGQVIRHYYDVMQLNARVGFLNTVIKYYEDRLAITEERWQVGKGSKIDFLQSKTDLNAQLAERSRSLNNFRTAKVGLNALLNRPFDTDFVVQDEVRFQDDYVLAELLKKSEENNWDLLRLRQMNQVSTSTIREWEAARKPQVSLSAALGYYYTNTNAGFLLSNQNAALNAGLNARWNIFDGRHIRNQIAIAEVHRKTVDKRTQELQSLIRAELTAAYNQYQADRELLEFEQENRLLAEENLSISLEKFRLGASTILELNEAQRGYDAALNRLVNAQHNIRMSELILLELTGELLR